MVESPQIEAIQNQMYARNMMFLMYRLLDDRDKFIIMSILQNNWTQEDVALCIGISQEAVCKRLKRARDMLKMEYGDKVIF